MAYFIEEPKSKGSLAKRKLVCGIGVNDADYITCRKFENGKRLTCPYYRAWSGMMKRCYTKNWHKVRPNYIGCTVVSEWHIFSSFRKWMETQDWKGKDLDKDIKIPGNKIYGPETCIFLRSEMNKLLNSNEARMGKYPTGVIENKLRTRFVAKCNVNGKQKTIGTFDTPEQASLAYRETKRQVIIDTANLPENEYIREYLLNHADLLLPF